MITSIRNNSITLLIFLSVLLGAAQLAMASEVTGTLSSDGSSGVQKETVLGNTNSQSSESGGQVVTQQKEGQLQGRVIQGKDESALASFIDTSSWNIVTWVVLPIGLLFITLTYFLWRARII